MTAAGGGQPVDLTAGMPTSPAWIEWGGNERLFVSQVTGGNCELIRLQLSGDKSGASVKASSGMPVFRVPGTIGGGRMELSLSSTADRPLFVFHASTFDRPTEIYEAKSATSTTGFDGLTQLTHINDGVEPGWGKSEIGRAHV